MAESFPENQFPSVGNILSPRMRYLLATGIFLLLLVLFAGTLAIPFFFESPSIWYKFGIEKISLRTGKVLGLATGLLLLLQLPLAGRLKILDRIFSMPKLIRRHRIHAWGIAMMALIHPACILLPEGVIVIPLEMRYWPEWVGWVCGTLILIQVGSSQWRQRLGLAFDTWLQFHRTTGLLIVILLVVHVLYVSESFTDWGLPRLAVFVAAGLFSLLWLWVRTGWLRVRSRPYAVARIESTGTNSTCVVLTPATQVPFPYIPGQFAFVSFRSVDVSPEPHAFTLSSTPSRPGQLEFIIRTRGDWARNVGRLSIGDQALIQGPFGRFSHLFSSPNRELIMIAGGIGITPMLSMLRFMVDFNDIRPITLIWSNRDRGHMVFAEEMDALVTQLTGLHLIPIFTGNAGSTDRSGRLNRASLKGMLDGCSRGAAVYVCCPSRMTKQVNSDLQAIGFPARSIFSEEFGF